jgi:hypothetical protein
LLISATVLPLGKTLAQEQPITAVYKAQEVSFQYRSSRYAYSCPELEQRVANILRVLGARDDIQVSARNCNVSLMPEDPFEDPRFERDSTNPWDRGSASGRFGRTGGSERDRSASVRVRLMMPVEVTPQVLAEIDKDKSRRELVSRVTGNPAAAFNDPIVFAARRQEVTLGERPNRLRPEDCDLLEQMTSQLLRRLDMRVIRRSFNCRPELSNIPPQLVVETLMPTGQLLPMPDPEKEKTAPKTEEPAAEPPPP